MLMKLVILKVLVFVFIHLDFLLLKEIIQFLRDRRLQIVCVFLSIDKTINKIIFILGV